MTTNQEKAAIGSRPDVVTLDDAQVRQMSVSHAHVKDLVHDAANATQAEQSMSLWQG